MNIKPLADRVLVLPAQAEEKTASGIIIPDTAKEKPQRYQLFQIFLLFLLDLAAMWAHQLP